MWLLKQLKNNRSNRLVKTIFFFLSLPQIARMKKYLIALIFTAFLLMFFVPDSSAQCAMCKRIAQTDKQNKTVDKGRSLNNGILYLLSIPYLIGAAGAIAWYRNRKKMGE